LAASWLTLPFAGQSVAKTAPEQHGAICVPVVLYFAWLPGCSPDAGAGKISDEDAHFRTWLPENNLVSINALDQLTSRSLADALKFSVRAAAITCSRRGDGMPRPGELF
jgi:hypothetical protein